MADRKKFNPYGDNILINELGPILNRSEAISQLIYRPPVPKNIGSLSKLERLHCLLQLLDLHIPSLEGGRIYETIDLLLRQSYRYRNPSQAETWSIISGEQYNLKNIRAPAMAAAITGHSGTGKTQSIIHALNCYPEQVIIHDTFPNIVGPHAQVVWLSVDAPSTGRSADLAENLMTAWDDTLSKHIKDYNPRFASSLSKDRRDGQKMLNEWRQVALSGSLGVLHLDEVQNLFKLATLKQRRTRNNPDSIPELSIIEDQCLKWILSLLNTWQIPVITSGTLDGIGALTKRLSTTERISTGGYHKLTQFTKPTDKSFSLFFKQLLKYQYVKHPLPDSENLRQLILDLTAGVPRIIITLWIFAHRVAFEHKEDSLRMEDFEKATKTFLAPLAPAIAALNSGNPEMMARFDDLLPRDDAIWASFWQA